MRLTNLPTGEADENLCCPTIRRFHHGGNHLRLVDCGESSFRARAATRRTIHRVVATRHGAVSSGVQPALLLREAAATARRSDLVATEVRVQHDLVRLGHAGEAAAHLSDLAARTDSVSVQARARHAAATVDGSSDSLESAAAVFDRLGMWLLAAEAFTSAAAAYANAGRRRAQACRRRAASLRTRCQGARTPGMLLEDHVSPLTPREREVVTMAANGLTSKTIAERLVISVRTVNNLIQRAYLKLGVHNRREAAAMLGLGADPTSTSQNTSS